MGTGALGSANTVLPVRAEDASCQSFPIIPNQSGLGADMLLFLLARVAPLAIGFVAYDALTDDDDDDDTAETRDESDLGNGAPVSLDLLGDEGPDVLEGGPGDDTLSGLDGDDELRGRAGNDVLSGGLGEDRIFCGRGDELLIGGGLTDTLERLPLEFVGAADGLSVEVQLNGETVVRLLRHSELSLGTPEDVLLR